VSHFASAGAAATPSPSPTSNLQDEVGSFEKDRIISALATCEGNQTKAAKLLGLTRRALITRLDAYDLPRPRRR
jgi:DNA-binding NtrC family response regulator